MTPAQRELARHALGLDRKRRSYRNRFVCREDNPEWSAMVAVGLATMRPAASVPFGGDAVFYLTTAGAKLAIDAGETLSPEDFPDA